MIQAKNYIVWIPSVCPRECYPCWGKVNGDYWHKLVHATCSQSLIPSLPILHVTAQTLSASFLPMSYNIVLYLHHLVAGRNTLHSQAAVFGRIAQTGGINIFQVWDNQQGYLYHVVLFLDFCFYRESACFAVKRLEDERSPADIDEDNICSV